MHEALLNEFQVALGERYRIHRQVESGPYSTAFLATDAGGRQVALSVVHAELVPAAGDRARMLRELAGLTRLRHPHVLPILEVGEAAQLLYYSTPFIAGGSLRDRLQTGPLPLADALRIGEEIAEALAYAHLHAVLHRDLTPDNVLLDSGRVVVKGFWIARALRGALSDRLTAEGTVVGTPGFMSPEQLSGEPVDERSDVYSLAVLICEMLANELPFKGKSPTEIAIGQLSGPGPSPRNLPRALPPGIAVALARALARLPRDRFATARELVEACRTGAAKRAPATAAPLTVPQGQKVAPPTAPSRIGVPLAARRRDSFSPAVTIVALTVVLVAILLRLAGTPGATPVLRALVYGAFSLAAVFLVIAVLRRLRSRATWEIVALAPRPAHEPFERFRVALQYQYDLVHELGRGGMAVVYMARDLRYPGRKVAVKVLRPEYAASVMSERFLQEIEITAQLAHPAILPLLDSGDADGMPFYVMPFVEGETLKSRIDREGRLSLTDSLALTRNVAGALDYAHRRKIVHRDIKPENILIHEGQATVTDFGIALALDRSRERRTQHGRSLGTPEFMSPEQFWDTANIDHRSDLYSLGCVFFEMLAGEPPYRGNHNELATKHLSAPIPHICNIRPDLPELIDAALCRVLAKNRADRFDSAPSFVEALTGPS